MYNSNEQANRQTDRQSDRQTREWFVILQTSQLHYEHVYTVVPSSSVQSCHHNGMSGCVAHLIPGTRTTEQHVGEAIMTFIGTHHAYMQQATT